jgi:hypothetical protein
MWCFHYYLVFEHTYETDNLHFYFSKFTNYLQRVRIQL